MTKKSKSLMIIGILLLLVGGVSAVYVLSGSSLSIPGAEPKKQITCDVDIGRSFGLGGLELQKVSCFSKSSCDIQFLPFTFFGAKGTLFLRAGDAISQSDVDVEVLGTQTKRLNICALASTNSVAIDLIDKNGSRLATKSIGV